MVLDPIFAAGIGQSPRRAAHYAAAVGSLARDIAARGSSLIVRRGALAPTVRRLARGLGVEAVLWSSAYDAATVARQRTLQAALEEMGLRAGAVHDSPAVSPEETAAVRTADGGRGYRSFVPYLRAWSQVTPEPLRTAIRLAATGVASEALPAASEFGAAPRSSMVSAEAAGAALTAFLDGPALAYSTGQHTPAGSPTSQLAADLAIGTISARTVLARINERLRDPFLLAEEREGLRDYTKALARRDFFLQLAWFFEDVPDAILQPKMQSFRFARSHRQLSAWREGRTGYPLVDAGIRQLHATGWMHPRVRLVAASFLCFDLGVDWRVGRDEWDRYLIEDEPALATGNWQWIAGVGADLAAYPRIYNPVNQARRYDPSASYVRRWIAELARIPGADVLDPATAAHRPQLALDLFDGDAYPAPVLDHAAVARAFLERYVREVGSAAPATL